MIRLEVIRGQQEGYAVESDAETVTIGRSPDATLTLTDEHLSYEHGRIYRAEGELRYRDLGTTNGSMVVHGAQKVVLDGVTRREAALRDGSELLLGDATQPVVVRCVVSHGAHAPHSPQKIVATVALRDAGSVASRVEQGPQLSRLYGAVKSFGAARELSTVLGLTAEAIFALVPRATHLALMLPRSGEAREGESTQYVPVLARARDAAAEAPTSEPVMMSRTLLKRVLKDRSAVVLADAAADLGRARSVMAGSIRSAMGVPLWCGERIIGVIECDNRATSGIFSQRELELLLVLAHHAGLAIDKAQLHQELRLAEERLQGENRYLRRRETEQRFERIVGESSAMKKVFEQLRKVASTSATVCVLGETGTGKELIARAIHEEGARREGMFVAQNCAALPEQLLESELFGHKRGAFTGADQDKKGLFEVAHGGTLFLDEVGEMALSLQAKLLRVLQEKEIRPLGASRSKPVDVRIICATNRKLEDEVESGRFRQDLFYRLMVFPIALPPLRDRRDDIVPLLRQFLAQYGSEFKKRIGGISQEATNQLVGYRWPGNIRELQNEAQRIVIQIEDGAIIEAAHLSPQIRQIDTVVGQITHSKGTLKQMMEAVEHHLLTEALREHGHNKTKTAATLGMTREGLHKKLAKHGIT